MSERKIIEPKFIKTMQWNGYENQPWLKKHKKDVTVLFSFVERRKSLFLSAYFTRKKIKHIDMGDHLKEDMSLGKLYGNRMECNPMYFTAGSLLRYLQKIESETGMTKKEISKKYIFMCGGGQCGPCRYGMYPQEYLKILNDAGYENFRLLIFGSDIGKNKETKNHALRFELSFRIDMAVALILADMFHAAECAFGAYAKNKAEMEAALTKGEEIVMQALKKPHYHIAIFKALKKVNKLFCSVAIDKTLQKPLIFVTGEFFSNLAHNDGNYNLRRFISKEGCEVMPGSFTQRTLYDNWRRTVEATRKLQFAQSKEEIKLYKKSIKKQQLSSKVIKFIYKKYDEALKPEQFRARTKLYDLDHLAELGREYYNPEIFGGEGNLEIAEAVYLAQENEIDGFISTKPFGCMPSSGVSDGVMSKITTKYPNLNFLSIETSGDNDVSILSRVSMLLFKAKQIRAQK